MLQTNERLLYNTDPYRIYIMVSFPRIKKTQEISFAKKETIL